MEFKINENTIFLVKIKDKLYQFENIHNLKTYHRSENLNGRDYDIYFRSSKIEGKEIIFTSLFLNKVNLEEIKVEENTYKIECEEVSGVNRWTRKIQLTPPKRTRVTKEIAQERMDALGYEFKIKEWNGTNKPATIICNECGKEITFKKGSSVYHTTNGTRGFGGFIGYCNHYIKEN